MSNSKTRSTLMNTDSILNYVDSSKGLKARTLDNGRIAITQNVDAKVFTFQPHDVTDVLQRSDSDGKPFLQVNFKSNVKVLLTDNLVGFKPTEIIGLDMSRIPKVVTTPDLKSVFEAVEESLGADSGLDHESEILKRVLQAILTGAEKAGFDLPEERAWFNRLAASRFQASA